MPGLASDATAQWYRRAGARATLVLATIATSLASAGPGDPALARFIEETDSAGLQSRFDGDFEFQVGGGVASFDCDGDALPEVYVTGGVGTSTLPVRFLTPPEIVLITLRSRAPAD